MPIINIKIIIKNKDDFRKEKAKAILLDKKLKYQENDQTKVNFNYTNNELLRENQKIKMKYLFSEQKETKGIIYLKDLKKYIDIPIKTNKIKRNNNSIYIEYMINNNKYYYEIEEIIWVSKKN